MDKIKLRYLILLFLVIFTCVSCENSNKNATLFLLRESYKAKIIDIFKDEANHDIYAFRIENANGNREKKIIAHYPNSWLYANVGDSIIKKEGEAFITIKKRNGETKIFELRIK